MLVRRRYPSLFVLLALAALLPLALAPGAAEAQRPERQCFPETGHCISGPILSYWRNLRRIDPSWKTERPISGVAKVH